MSKYRTATPLAHSTHYHSRDDCKRIKTNATTVSAKKIEWHGLEPCPTCCENHE